jgi:PAS domain S-box-containing protein
MIKLTGRQATILAALAFASTLLLTYILPGYSITLGGLVLVISLSVIIPDKRSTLIAMGVSIGIVLAHLFLLDASFTVKSMVEHIFVLLLICLTSLVVLYLKRLLRNMEFDKTHMTALFENATEGIVLTDSSASIILINPAAERMFGYTGTEIIGQKVEVFLPPRYRPGHVNLRNGFVKEPAHRSMGSGRDLFAQRKDGSQFPVEVSLSHYQRGEALYVIAFLVDITHRKEIEESMRKQQHQLEQVTNEIRSLNTELEAKVEERTVILKEALQRLEQSQAELSEALDKERQLNEIKSRFVSMASHEFRTPLSAVLSSASLLGKYTTTEQQPNREKHIRRIKDSVKNLNDILEDFLSLGKLDEGKVGAVAEPFSIKEKVEHTIEDLSGLLKAGQHIEYTHEGSAEEMVTDRKLLKNILINLVSNAIKFSAEGAEITVRSHIDGDAATIVVRDRGIGISEEDQAHLFSSFFRGKNAINIQGTGLGLHIVRRYLDLLGGQARLESALNEGTTITLTIPVHLPTPDNT